MPLNWGVSKSLTTSVLGLGKVGALAAALLHESGFVVKAYDQNSPAEDFPFAVDAVDLGSDDSVKTVLAGVEAVLSCLPFQLNEAIATAAHAAGIHYFDLTEDVATTNAILELSKTSKGLMAPQCGLAPGVRRNRRSFLNLPIRQLQIMPYARRRTAAKPDGFNGLCLQLVAGGRGKRVFKRLRSHRRR